MSQSRSLRSGRYRPTTARGPRVGVLGALLLHGLIAAGALFTWQHHLDITDESAPVVPVDLITIAPKTNIAPTVQRQPKVQPQETPTPPQLETPVPKPAPTPPQAEAAPDQAPSQPVIAKPAPTPKPMMKPQDAPVTPDQKKPKTDDFSALLNKLTSPAAAPRDAKVADRTVRGVGAMNAMTMDLVDALKNQIAQCWSPPVGAPHPERLIPQFKLFLAPDGRVAQPPQLAADSAAQAGSDPFMRAAVDAAQRAIYTCQPYKLPPDKYNEWRDITIDFDPRKMFQ
jgi:type IV secretory pathway VirB10-like protein